MKPKLILYICCTLDGYIAKENGDISFLSKFDGPNYGYNKFLKSIKSIIMGNNTYKQVKSFGEYPYKNVTTYVYSKKRTGKDNNVTFTKQNPKTLLKKLNGNIWLLGGSKIIQKFNKHIDEYIITLLPMILGKGIPLFLKSNTIKNLKLVSHKKFKNGVVQLTYRKLL